MNWPQITVIVLMAMDLGMALGKHGQERTVKNHNFWLTAFSMSIWAWLLWAGKFFS